MERSGSAFLLSLAALLLHTGSALAQGDPAGLDSSRVTVQEALNLREIDDVRPSPNGEWVAYVVSQREVHPSEKVHRVDSNIWVVPADGGEPTRLTRDSARDGSPRWSPNGNWIGFISDRGGKPQVWGIRPDGGEPWPVTEWTTGVEDFRFAPDGKRIGFTASPPQSDEAKKQALRVGRPTVVDSAYASEYTLLWTAPLSSGDIIGRPAPTADTTFQSSPDTLHVQDFVWAPAGRGIAWSARPRPRLQTYKEAAVYVQDSVGAAPRRVADLPGGDGVAAWHEEAGLLTTGSGRRLGAFNDEVWRVDPTGDGAPQSLTEALDHDASYVGIAPQDGALGRLLVESPIETGHGAYAISLAEAPGADTLQTGVPERIDAGALYSQDFAKATGGALLTFVAEGPATSPNAYVDEISLNGGSEAFSPRRLTSINPQASGFRLGEQRVVEWRSSAGEEPVEGVLTLPLGYEKGEEVPLLVDVHGGPAGVDGMDYKAGGYAYPTQVFAGLGYAVLQPNYRGSTGYGERFRNLIRGDISGGEWADINSGVTAMVERGIADPDRLGLMGWSYGGHQTFWGITQTDRFAAASAGAGATDLISMYSQTDIPSFYETYLGPLPWEDFELYEQRSSYRQVTEASTPLLIQVGEEDERVPAEQSIQFYEAAKRIGAAPEVKLVVYPGQGHGISEPRLRRDLMARNVRWFARWIPTTRSRAAGYPSEEQ
ncbi:MAG: prolyl oligopeptidase family serine peptidase [Salinibacter sp.]